MSAEKALSRYYQRLARQQERTQSPRRHNQKPEWELTKKPCMAWFGANRWLMSTVDAKAVFSHEAGRYVAGPAEAGFSDAVGCTPCGLAAFVEFKAPGRRGTLKPHQHHFLKERILSGAFAVCVDGVDCLEEIWRTFIDKRRIEPMLARNCLLKHLPQVEDKGDSFLDLLRQKPKE